MFQNSFAEITYSSSDWSHRNVWLCAFDCGNVRILALSHSH